MPFFVFKKLGGWKNGILEGRNVEALADIPLRREKIGMLKGWKKLPLRHAEHSETLRKTLCETLCPKCLSGEKKKITTEALRTLRNTEFFKSMCSICLCGKFTF